MEGNDYPDNNDDVCDTNYVHVVINPHYMIFLTAYHSIVKDIFFKCSRLSFRVWFFVGLLIQFYLFPPHRMTGRISEMLPIHLVDPSILG